MRTIMLIGSLLFVAAASGCASTPLRTEGSTSAIRAAEEIGAKDVPRAALHLQLAKENLEKAAAMAKAGDADKAKSLLARAEVDAELAVVLSRENSEKKDATEAVERVRQLRLANPERNLP